MRATGPAAPPRRRGMRISTRIVLGSLAVLLIAVVGLGVPLVYAVRVLSLERIEDELEESALIAASRVVDAVRSGDPNRVAALATATAEESGTRVTVLDASGRLLADTGGGDRTGEDFANRPEVTTALRGDVGVQLRRSATLGSDILVVAVPVAAGGERYGALRLLRPIADVRRDQQIATWQVAGIVAAVVAVGTAVALIVARTIAKPITAIRDAAGRIGAGERSARAPVAGPPETAELARTLNDAMERVEAAAETERSFVANAAHQLRTPLTALDLRLESLAAVDGLGADARRDVIAATDEVRLLSRLLSQLLVLARTGVRGGERLDEPVDLGPALRRVADQWRERLADAGIDLTVSIPHDLAPVRVPPELVAQAIENALDNVARYCPDSDAAGFRVENDPDEGLRLIVIDHGPGMDPDTAAHAFERFRRGTTATPGTGLGLAVVKEVAETAGGRAGLDSGPDGTTVWMTLPTSPNPVALGDVAEAVPNRDARAPHPQQQPDSTAPADDAQLAGSSEGVSGAG